MESVGDMNVSQDNSLEDLTSTLSDMNLYLTQPTKLGFDRAAGMISGLVTGDVLGSAHEFHTQSNNNYSGLITHRPKISTRWQGSFELELGQPTDDTEMTLTLLRSLVRNGGYNKEDVIYSYLRWANSGGRMLGKNTRAIFKGIKTLFGYNNRMNKILSLPIDQWSQSNGALMRCSPLALFSNAVELGTIDTSISNPSPIAIQVTQIYLTAVRMALLGNDRSFIISTISAIPMYDPVANAVNDAFQLKQRNISNQKGWCCHALYCALIGLAGFGNYSTAIDWIIGNHPGSDSDTNAAITGALLGAYYGLNAMTQESAFNYNIKVIMSAVPDRPPEYRVSDLGSLINGVIAVAK
jgi:ADP-ribosyl-[dinitrogen reductase] hydrolase